MKYKKELDIYEVIIENIHFRICYMLQGSLFRAG
jgi:hypothetical protein